MALALALVASAFTVKLRTMSHVLTAARACLRHTHTPTLAHTYTRARTRTNAHAHTSRLALAFCTSLGTSAAGAGTATLGLPFSFLGPVMSWVGGAQLGAGPSPLRLVDAAIVLCVGFFWLLQEWFIHDKVLHSEADWAGKAIHGFHHLLPYYHVSIDGPGLAVAWFSVAAAAIAAASPSLSAGLTAVATYTLFGGVYEFCHFISHTRVKLDRCGIRMHACLLNCTWRITPPLLPARLPSAHTTLPDKSRVCFSLYDELTHTSPYSGVAICPA